MSPRTYVSPARTAAVAETRARVIDAAGRLLREETNADFSLEAVAKAAGVTRLTLYNHFGSRRGLLEAVFDARARDAGLGRIAEAMATPDPRAALDRLIQIFCDFWSCDEAIGRLHKAASGDPELAEALADRNERRRTAIKVLLARIAPHVAGQRARDAIDLIFALTSYPMFEILCHGRSRQKICAIVKSACYAEVDGVVRMR